MWIIARALVDDPARLGGVLLGRVRDRRALVAVGDGARDRAGDDDGVFERSCAAPRESCGCSSGMPDASSRRNQATGRALDMLGRSIIAAIVIGIIAGYLGRARCLARHRIRWAFVGSRRRAASSARSSASSLLHVRPRDRRQRQVRPRRHHRRHRRHDDRARDLPRRRPAAATSRTGATTRRRPSERDSGGARRRARGARRRTPRASDRHDRRAASRAARPACPAAISSARMIVGRVSRGSITSSIMRVARRRRRRR